MALYLEQGEELAPEQLHAPFEKALREGHLIPVCFASARTGAGVDGVPRHPREARAQRDRRQSAAVPAGRESTEGEEFHAEPDPKKHVLAHVFKVIMDPYVGKVGVFRVHQGTITQGHAALHRRRQEALQGRPPLPAAGQGLRRGRRAGAGRHRRRGQDRRDRVQRGAARFARRGPHPPALARIPHADALDRGRDQEEGRRAAPVRGAAQARGRGSVPVDRAPSDHARDGDARPGRPAHARQAGEDGSSSTSSTWTPSRRRFPIARPSRARPRATAATRSRPAARASSARCTCKIEPLRARRGLRVRERGEGRRDSRRCSSPRWKRACARRSTTASSPAIRSRTCA